jgi:hypothetical protein
MGRPTCESSFLELPNAKLFVKTGGVKKICSRHREPNAFRKCRFLQRWVQGKGLKRRPFPYATPSRLITCTMGTVRTSRGMLLSYLGTRTQTPSSSPDPFPG